MKHDAAPCTGIQMPTTKHRITINLSDNEYGQLAALAEVHDVSMSWIGQRAIAAFLEHERAEALQLPLSFARRHGAFKWQEPQ
jgi:hypothetical protein